MEPAFKELLIVKRKPDNFNRDLGFIFKKIMKIFYKSFICFVSRKTLKFSAEN